MPTLGASELVIVLLIIVVIFGSTKLPQLGDGLGRAIKNFKRSVGGQNEIDVSPRKGDIPGETSTPVPPPATTPPADKPAKTQT
jgi:sec-independent protein translocase protein TatA